MSTINRWILTADTNGVSPTGTKNADAPTILRKCGELMHRAAQGACSSSLKLAIAPVASKATITFTGDCHNTYIVTLGNVVITFKTSGAAGASNEINIGSAGDGTDVAAYFAALINGSTSTAGFTTHSHSFEGICTASVSGAVVTLTSYIPGKIGNAIQLSKTEADVTLTNAWGASVAGTEGTSQAYSLGA